MGLATESYEAEARREEEAMLNAFVDNERQNVRPQPLLPGGSRRLGAVCRVGPASEGVKSLRQEVTTSPASKKGVR